MDELRKKLAQPNSPLRKKLNELCETLKNKEETLLRVLELLVITDPEELQFDPEKVRKSLENYRKILVLMNELLRLYPNNAKWKSCHKKLVLLAATVKLLHHKS